MEYILSGTVALALHNYLFISLHNYLFISLHYHFIAFTFTPQFTPL
jgi:hypothetical protein